MRVLYVIFSFKSLNFIPKWSLCYFQPISKAIFVTIATLKVKLILEFYSCAILLINQCKGIGEKHLEKKR